MKNHSRNILMVITLLSMAAVFAQTGGKYQLTGSVVDFEASSSSVGGYALAGGIIQRNTQTPPSESLTTGGYSLTGEFHVQAGPTPPLSCPGDLLDPPGVGVEDLLALMQSLATTDSSADLDNDGQVGASDLLILLANWGCVSEEGIKASRHQGIAASRHRGIGSVKDPHP